MKKENKSVRRTYQLSHAAVSSLEILTKRLSKEAGVELSMGKVLELIIFNAKTKTLHELLPNPAS